jgi:hypothetical protein
MAEPQAAIPPKTTASRHRVRLVDLLTLVGAIRESYPSGEAWIGELTQLLSLRIERLTGIRSADILEFIERGARNEDLGGDPPEAGGIREARPIPHPAVAASTGHGREYRRHLAMAVAPLAEIPRHYDDRPERWGDQRGE